MRVRGLATFFLVMTILLVMAVASEVYVQKYAKPRSLFGALALTTLIGGTISVIILENLGAKVFI